MKKSAFSPFYLGTVALATLLIVLGWSLLREDAHLFQNANGSSEELLCQVLEITDDDQKISALGEMFYVERTLSFDALVLRGPRKGERISAQQNLDNVSTFGVPAVEEGDKLLLYSSESDGVTLWHAGDYYRSGGLGVLALVFCGGLLFFGRLKGFSTVLSLAFTCGAVFCVFIPAVLSGRNVYLSSCLCCLYVIVVTLALVSGPSRKSLAAALGCGGGVLVAGLLTVLMTVSLKLSGFLDDNSMYVYLLNPDKPIDLKAILFAANIIGAMGATMDVAMSLSSSLEELSAKVPDLPFGGLFGAGLSIGRDIMGTMANTLVLAYIGSSLSTVLLFLSYQSSLLQLLNRELIVVELLQALSGSLGILLTIPLSSLAAAALYSRRRKA